MADRSRDSAGPEPPQGGEAKKPWRTPKIQTGRLFEANSLACGKNEPGMDACFMGVQQS